MLRNKSLKLRRSHRHIPEGFSFLLEGQPHPLLIPSIVDQVSSYLNVQDLKCFREVCRTWAAEANKRFRKLVKIVVQDEKGLANLLITLQASAILYTRFELRGEIDLGSDLVVKFFKTFGGPVEFIYLNRVSRWQEKDLKELLLNLLPNLETLAIEARGSSDCRLFPGESFQTLPNIKVLKLNIFSMITDMTTPFLRDLFRACPNLERITSTKNQKRNTLPMQFIQYVCQEMSYDTADDVVNMPFAGDIAIAEAIIDSKGVKLDRLAYLESNMRLKTTGIEALGLRGFPLRQIDITIMQDVSSRSLHDTLSLMESTLEVLKLKFHPKCPAADEIAVPPLKNLKQLSLNGYRNSLKFIESTPKLESLTLIRLYFTVALFKDQIQMKSPSVLESLEVSEDFSRKCRQATVSHLVQLFPRIRRLKLENLTDAAVCAIFMGYPELEQFDAMNGFYSDIGITGIVPETFETILEENNDNSDDGLCGKADVLDVQAMRQHPSVANLKNLRSLSLASPKITDLSVLYGVLQCRSLKNLHLSSFGVTDISMERIITELDLFKLKTEHCYKLSKYVVDLAKKTLRGRQVNINEYAGPFKQSQIPKFLRRNGRVTVLVDKFKVSDE